MAISPKLDSYLTEHNISYQMIEHHHSTSSIGSAIMAKVPFNQIAKAVILKDHEDRKLMAILPAKNKISLSALNDELFASYHLLKEKEVYRMFSDCEHGAIPPVGEAYNINTVCDEMLDSLDVVYIEAGDHQNLLGISHDDFQTMVADCKHLRFSREVFH
jgi:Ala-tRNA(Pro) deacylase